jgi:heme/copper-type cytochrome/quinol oxidase subunit 2
MAGLGLLLLVASVVALAVQVWALVEAARRPEEHLAQRGGKTLWVVLLGVFLVVPGGFLLGLVCLVAIRPRGARADLD